MDWIHCNSCFKQPRQSAPDRKFLLTSCGHIYCNSCADLKDIKETCRVCKSSYTTIELTENMKPDVMEYFQEVETCIKKLLGVMVFQNGHRQRLTTNKRLLDDKYTVAKEEVRRLHDVNRTKDKKIHELELAVKYYKKKVEDLQATTRPSTSTPMRMSKALFPTASPSPILSGSNLTQRILQSTQGMDRPREKTWLTPNRLTLHYKSKFTSPPEQSQPSPDSSMTPSRSSGNKNYMGYRKSCSGYLSQSSMPGEQLSPNVPGISPNTPGQGSRPTYNRSSGMSISQHSSLYEALSNSPLNLKSLSLVTKRVQK